ncbi:MAG: hypothetical protein AB1644_12885 [Candidatus Zixiibacteriota bacterium]
MAKDIERTGMQKKSTHNKLRRIALFAITGGVAGFGFSMVYMAMGST